MAGQVSEKETEDRILFLGQLLEKVVATNSFFITAGYGTFFGLWAIVRDDLSADLQLAAGLWLLLSAAMFALWHVIGSTTMTLTMMRITDAGEGQARRWRIAIAEAGTKLIARAWIPVMLAIVVTALLGVGTLAFGMLQAILCK